MDLLNIFRKKPAGNEPSHAPRGLAPLAAKPQQSVTVPLTAALRPAADMPAALAAFVPASAASLPPGRQATIVNVFKDIPRPPKLLHQLLSPDFVGKASSAELADLIVAEPQIAARLLATINSPAYGLRSPVASVDQSVTLLGLTAVRSICLQYLMIHSFRADSPERQRVLEATWQASALACELTQRLAMALGYPELGSLVSRVVLTFLGRLATASTMPKALLAQVPSRGFLERVSAEQARMGLSSSEIGRLLMIDWGLPDQVVTEAVAVDSVLVTPVTQLDPVQASRQALCYLCARIGERLAEDPDFSLASFDLSADEDPEFFHLHGYLGIPALAPVGEKLRAESVLAVVERMRSAYRAKGS